MRLQYQWAFVKERRTSRGIGDSVHWFGTSPQEDGNGSSTS